MNFTGVLGAERARQLERFVDDDGRRRRRIAQQLADRHAQDQAIEDRHPLGPPPLGGLGDQRIDRRQPARPCRAPAPSRTSRSSSGGGSASGHCSAKNVSAARATSRRRSPTDTGSAAPPRARDDAGPCSRAGSRAAAHARAGCPVSCATTTAISIGGGRRFPPLVGRALAGALQRLLDRVRRQHAERHRHAGRAGGRRRARATPPTRCTRSAASRPE